MGPCWGHGPDPEALDAPLQLHPQAAHHRQRQTQGQGLRPDRGGDVIIEIVPGGSKTWRYKYYLAGKREKVTIGAYPVRSASCWRRRTLPRRCVARCQCHPKTHHPHLSTPQLGAFWRSLDKQGNAHATTILAAKLPLLTMARKMELLRAKKAEFDRDAGVWDVPAERMKTKRVHRVPLSSQAVELLHQLFQITAGSDYPAPSIFNSDTPMGETTLNHFFKRLDFGMPEFSPHSLRGTAATILRERLWARRRRAAAAPRREGPDCGGLQPYGAGARAPARAAIPGRPRRPLSCGG